ncbi:MAG: MFS transporter [Bacillota bacterium]|nr:MFS transporter [Bacillota bacterium]
MDKNKQSGVSARTMLLVTAAFWSAQYSYAQFINPELTAMGASAAVMGMVSGIYGLAQTLVRIPLGILADRKGHQKPFVVLGCLLAALPGIGMTVFKSPASFVFFRGIAGLAAASWVSFTVLYASYYSHEEGPSRISHLNIPNMSGRFVSYLLVLLVIPRLGTRFAFIFSSLSGLLAVILSLTLHEEPHQPQGINLKAFLKVSKDPYLLACTLLSILTQAIAFSTYFNFTINVARNLGADNTQLTWVNISLLIPIIITTYLITSGFLKKFSAVSLVGAGFLLTAAYCFLMARVTSLPQLFVLQALAGSGNALTFNVLLGQSVRDIKQEMRAVAMGLHQALYGVGMTIGPILTGVLIDLHGIRTAFDAVAVLALFAAALSLKLMRVKPGLIEE